MWSGCPLPEANAMKRILFVDDEPQILNGLRRMLRSRRGQWDLNFAVGAEEALSILQRSPMDVIVTDMRMPGMDGAALLAAVNDRFPGVIRIVLSGYHDRDAGIRAATVAHHFLNKPCTPEDLQDAIERAILSVEAMRDEPMRRVVNAVGALPSLPANCAALLRAIEDPATSVASVAKAIARDVGALAKVLQLANSAFFCQHREVNDAVSAVSVLGLETVKQLVVSAEVFKTFQPPFPIPHFSLECFDRHCHLTGAIANGLMTGTAISGLSVTAAVLHDAGKLVLAKRFPERYSRVCAASWREDRPLHWAEQEEFGASHAEIGACLLDMWGLPVAAVDAIRNHHSHAVPKGAEPQASSITAPRELDLRSAVQIANALANECAATMSGGLASAPLGLDMEALAVLGCDPRIPAWRAMARRLAI